jgi:hypothetical protein
MLLREKQLSGSGYSTPFQNPKVLNRVHKKGLLPAHTLNQVDNTATCRGVCVTNIMGSRSDLLVLPYNYT